MDYNYIKQFVYPFYLQNNLLFIKYNIYTRVALIRIKRPLEISNL